MYHRRTECLLVVRAARYLVLPRLLSPRPGGLMRYLTALIASAVTVLMLAACGSSTSSFSSPGLPPSSQQPSSPPSTISQPQSSSDAVTGTVSWPDGNPAANASVYFNNHDPGFSGNGWNQGQ